MAASTIRVLNGKANRILSPKAAKSAPIMNVAGAPIAKNGAWIW